MTRHRATVVAAALVAAVLLALQANVFAGLLPRAVDVAASPPEAASSRFERYHYSVAARIRPLLVFWVSRSGVGDAVVTRQRAPGETRYSLLIGSDPERAPRRINRWGYIEEKIRGEEAQLVGLMTQSEEDSLEQAEGNVRRQHVPATSPINFVYHGGLYELRQTRARTIPNLRIAHASYGRATATDFVITSIQDGEQSRFSMTYGTEAPYVEVPLIVTYQPRWWMQVELTLDAGADPALSDRVER